MELSYFTQFTANGTLLAGEMEFLNKLQGIHASH
jgi:hypothetical protein